MNNQYPTFIPAADVCRILDIKPATLYSYVSRGLVRKETRGRKKSRYLTADVMRLKQKADARAGHGPAAAEALTWGQPVIQTSISAISEDETLTYRGISPLTLIENHRRYESAAELLWSGNLPEEDPEWVRAAISENFPCEALPSDCPFPTTAAMMLPYMAACDPDRHLMSIEKEWERARRIIRVIAASVALPESRSLMNESMHQPQISKVLGMALGLLEEAMTNALDTAMILCAEHELNASTFAARIAASTGADLYSCLSSALGAYSGPKHGQAVGRVLALLKEINTQGDAATVVRERLARGELLPGFGHKLYPSGDPRYQPLRDAAVHLAPKSVDVAHLCNVVDTMEQAGLFKPTLDMGLAMLVTAMKLPPAKASSVFMIGRMAGWIAHILEQRTSPGLLRPRAEYIHR
ncbi:MAG: citrate/2-methylcitrate synthase [Verrucomicrobiales bacterium]|nr:citrate/2-methylcitrate synthase [Verrucomicrobiales bacterium]